MLEGINLLGAEIGVVLAIAATCALLAKALRLPVIIGYVGAGLIVGPLLRHTPTASHLLESSQHIAFTVLLFLVGVETDWRQAREQFGSAIWIAIIQMACSFAFGMFIAQLFSFSLSIGIFLGIALTFTSGVVSLKLLAERHDLSSLHGRLASSILFVQDIVAIGLLAILHGFASRNSLTELQETALLLIRGVAVATLFWGISKLVVTRLFKACASSTELLLLMSFAWCFTGTAAFQLFGLPMEAGAILAGLSLASLPYGIEILSKIRSLRDFFLIFFFVNVGAIVVIPNHSYAALSIAIIIGVTLGRPLITYLSLSLSGYRVRTAFLTSIAQASVSEFALIFALIGAETLHLPEQLISAISLATLVSICVSALLTTNRQRLYHLFLPVLRLTERGHHLHPSLIRGEAAEKEMNDHTVIFGYHRMGYHILQQALKSKQQPLIIDFNPEVVAQLRHSGITALYGDAEDEQIFYTASIAKAGLVVSTIPHREETEYLLKTVKRLNRDVPIIVTAKNVEDALSYYRLHASYVLLPHLLASEHIGELIKHQQEGSIEHMAKGQVAELKQLLAEKKSLFSD